MLNSPTQQKVPASLNPGITPFFLFRATQAEDKLRRERIVGKTKANTAHREVGAKVRQTIKELGGTMPEELPTAESIKRLESDTRKTVAKKTS